MRRGNAGGVCPQVLTRATIETGQCTPLSEITEDAESLTQAIMAAGMLPPHAVRDAVHVAVAAVHAIDYLLTWNCKHLANAQMTSRIAMVCEKAGCRKQYYWVL